MAEHKISTKFVTTGKRPVIVVRSGDRKAQYPSPMSTTKTHLTAAKKFAVKIMGKDASFLLRPVESGPLGDRFEIVSIPEVDENGQPVAVPSKNLTED